MLEPVGIEPTTSRLQVEVTVSASPQGRKTRKGRNGVGLFLASEVAVSASWFSTAGVKCREKVETGPILIRSNRLCVTDFTDIRNWTLPVNRLFHKKNGPSGRSCRAQVCGQCRNNRGEVPLVCAGRLASPGGSGKPYSSAVNSSFADFPMMASRGSLTGTSVVPEDDLSIRPNSSSFS